MIMIMVIHDIEDVDDNNDDDNNSAMLELPPNCL